MLLFIQHEDMSDPLLEVIDENVNFIPNVGDTLSITYSKTLRQGSILSVMGRHYYYNDCGELESIQLFVKGNLPEQDKSDWQMREEQLQEWLDSIGKKEDRVHK